MTIFTDVALTVVTQKRSRSTGNHGILQPFTLSVPLDLGVSLHLSLPHTLLVSLGMIHKKTPHQDVFRIGR